MTPTCERCTRCDELTGRAGKADDSLYCDACGAGPFCVWCSQSHNCAEKLAPPGLLGSDSPAGL